MVRLIFVILQVAWASTAFADVKPAPDDSRFGPSCGFSLENACPPDRFPELPIQDYDIKLPNPDLSIVAASTNIYTDAETFPEQHSTRIDYNITVLNDGDGVSRVSDAHISSRVEITITGVTMAGINSHFCAGIGSFFWRPILVPAAGVDDDGSPYWTIDPNVQVSTLALFIGPLGSAVLLESCTHVHLELEGGWLADRNSSNNSIIIPIL